MPQDVENDDTGEEDISVGDETDEPDSTKPDPFDLRNHVRGIVILVAVCVLLWTLSKYGPGGADWLGNQTKALFGLKPSVTAVETKESEPKKPDQIEPLNPKEKEKPEAKNEVIGDPRIANATKTILETLGGPEKVIVQHVAISSDDTSMVAAIKLIEPDGTFRLEEIFFEQDDFGRYISAEDSPVEPVIKIWKQE